MKMVGRQKSVLNITSSEQKDKRSIAPYKILSRAILLPAMVSIVLAGCTVMPDRAVRTAFVSKEVGYPGMPIDKRTAPVGKRGKTALTNPVRASYPGRAPYICSPSGFGRTSSCFLRKG